MWKLQLLGTTPQLPTVEVTRHADRNAKSTGQSHLVLVRPIVPVAAPIAPPARTLSLSSLPTRHARQEVRDAPLWLLPARTTLGPVQQSEMLLKLVATKSFCYQRQFLSLMIIEVSVWGQKFAQSQSCKRCSSSFRANLPFMERHRVLISSSPQADSINQDLHTMLVNHTCTYSTRTHRAICSWTVLEVRGFLYGSRSFMS